MIVTAENINQLLTQKLESREWDLISLDTETTGLEESDRPFAVIIADEKETYYFDERCLNFWINEKFRDIFSDSHRIIAYQNAKFDMRMIATGFNRSGLSQTNYCQSYDNAIAARLFRNDCAGNRPYSLDAQAKRYLNKDKDDRVKKYIKEHHLFEKRRDFFGVEYEVPRYDLVPAELMSQYAQTDARLTYDLHKFYQEKLDPKSKELLDMESKLTKVCFKMERRGVPLDVAYTLEAYHAEKEERQRALDMFKVVTGKDFVNSALSIGKCLDVPLPKTAKGNPTCTDEIIEKFLAEEFVSAKDKKILKIVQQIRFFEKRVVTYFESYLNKQVNGLLHPSMWQAGTTTGRFSYSDPNLQNIPKEEEPDGLYIVRRCIAPRPGKILVSFDYSQMEYRMMADYAHAKFIIARVLMGEDFHQITANLFRVNRKTAKTLNFALLYGAGVDKLAQMLKVDVKEAFVLREKYFLALPEVEKLVNNVIAKGKHRGYVRTWSGRRLYAAKHECYKLPNHLIQGGGADVVKFAMVKIDEEFPSLNMFLQVHDQLVFEMDENELRYIPRIKEIMENVYVSQAGMKLTVDVSWSKKSFAEVDMEEWRVPS